MSMIGFDTSLAVTSACVLRDDGEPFCTEPPDPDRLFEPAAHSQELLPELVRLVDESQTSWEAIESIAVGTGPGTFTGLRIGVATARALGQALGIGLRPVSSLEALAAGAASELDTDVGRPLLALIDARRRQVFTALYQFSERAEFSGIGDRRPALAPVWEPAVMDPDGLTRRIHELGSPPVCIGDWAIKSRPRLEEVGAHVPPSESRFHAVSALQVCRLAVDVQPLVAADVYPVYLRLPDAEINRRLALGQLDDTDDRRDSLDPAPP